MLIQISRIKDEHGLQASVQVLQESFSTVAREFNLTRENAPSNAAFIGYKDLLEIVERGAYLYGLYEHGKQIGFFTLERVQNDLCYLNKLAILLPTGIKDMVDSYCTSYLNMSKGWAAGVYPSVLLMKTLC